MEAVKVEFTVRSDETIKVDALSVDVKIEEPVNVE